MYISNYDETGLAFALSWNLQGGASLDCTVLPIELLAFTASAFEDHIGLKWTTGSEQMSDHFVVERSNDAIDFEPIGQLPATGNSNQQVEYGFEDRSPEHGLNYYRLRQVDIDGSNEVSSIVSAFFENGTFISEPYPMPALDIVAMDILGTFSAPLVVTVRDPIGRVVADRRVEPRSDGRVVLQIACGGWVPGLYSMEVRTGDGSLLKVARWVKH